MQPRLTPHTHTRIRSGYKALALLEGRADVYVHVGAIHKWDVCAADAIVSATGGRLSDLGGRTVHYLPNASHAAVRIDGVVAAVRDHASWARAIGAARHAIAAPCAAVGPCEMADDADACAAATDCVPCTEDADCAAPGPPRSAPRPACDAARQMCVPRRLWPLGAREWLATLLCAVGSMLSAGGGVGGGGLFVPLLLLVLQAPPASAIALSKATIFGGACANFVVNARRRHPSAARPLIDYATALMLEPATLVGTLAGVQLSMLLPRALLLRLLLVLLAYTCWRTVTKGLAMWREESAGGAAAVGPTTGFVSATAPAPRLPTDTASHAALASSASPIGSATAGVLLDPVGATAIFGAPSRPPGRRIAIGDARTERSIDERTALLREESIMLPWHLLLPLILIAAATWALAVLHGVSARFASPLMQHAHALGVVAVSLLAAWITWRTGAALCRRDERRLRCGLAPLPGDIHWTRSTRWRYPLLSGIAGVAAGLFGIGGGMIKVRRAARPGPAGALIARRALGVQGPLLLELGMLPVVMAATSAFMILLTSAATVAQFVAYGARWRRCRAASGAPIA